MMILIVGGSGSGKSSYAEETACSVPKRLKSQRINFLDGIKKYYLATMQVFDEEGKRKVEKHRKLRSGKGFLTIEQPVRIQGALEKMEKGESVVLLECISNLTANEMFAGDAPKPEIQVVENVVSGVRMLKENTVKLVVVSNNVFEDGIIYDQTTMDYIHAMGEINRRLAAMADQVVEVVAGIPLVIKQQTSESTQNDLQMQSSWKLFQIKVW